MGRTLAALLFLGLVVVGARSLAGWWTGGSEGEQGSATTTSALASDSVAARGILPTAAPPTSSAEALSLKQHLSAGRTREAVAAARSLDGAARRDPEVAALALEAALALASSDGVGPADRVARADEARRLLGVLVVEGMADWGEVEKVLGRLNQEVLAGRREVPGAVRRFEIKAGDTLDRLLRGAWKGQVSAAPGLILDLNGVSSPDRLRPGPLYVPTEPVRILVRKSEHRLWFLLGEVPLRSYPVGLGMNGRTPEGAFIIEERMSRPDYWPPGGKRVPFGHPDNPLGTRWLGFQDRPDARGFGIHGTDDPASIGKNQSQGCVRLLNADVESLFQWVSASTPVEILP